MGDLYAAATAPRSPSVVLREVFPCSGIPLYIHMPITSSYSYIHNMYTRSTYVQAALGLTYIHVDAITLLSESRALCAYLYPSYV